MPGYLALVKWVKTQPTIPEQRGVTDLVTNRPRLHHEGDKSASKCRVKENIMRLPTVKYESVAEFQKARSRVAEDILSIQAKLGGGGAGLGDNTMSFTRHTHDSEEE